MLQASAVAHPRSLLDVFHGGVEGTELDDTHQAKSKATQPELSRTFDQETEHAHEQCTIRENVYRAEALCHAQPESDQVASTWFAVLPKNDFGNVEDEDSSYSWCRGGPWCRRVRIRRGPLECEQRQWSHVERSRQQWDRGERKDAGQLPALVSCNERAHLASCGSHRSASAVVEHVRLRLPTITYTAHRCRWVGVFCHCQQSTRGTRRQHLQCMLHKLHSVVSISHSSGSDEAEQTGLCDTLAVSVAMR